MFESQIAEGTQYLDDIFGPRWVFDVNPQGIYMAAGCCCVLAQVGEDEDFDKTREYLELTIHECIRLGFYLDMSLIDEGDSENYNYHTLSLEWRKQVQILQEERES